MCGIVGYMGKSFINCEKAFLDMLQVDVIRGPHSTGVAFIKEFQRNAVVVKGADLPQYLMVNREFKEALNGFNKAFLGHNRFATQGKINDENAHPFIREHIIGMHNGTVPGKWRFPEHTKFETDSEAIINSIAVQGIEKTWALVDGAAALVWWDREQDSLSMIRNSERPLSFALTKDGDGLFWASESWILRGCAARNGVELDQVYILGENTLFEFTYDKKLIQKEVARKLVPFDRKAASSTGIKKGLTGAPLGMGGAKQQIVGMDGKPLNKRARKKLKKEAEAREKAAQEAEQRRRAIIAEAAKKQGRLPLSELDPQNNPGTIPYISPVHENKRMAQEDLAKIANNVKISILGENGELEHYEEEYCKCAFCNIDVDKNDQDTVQIDDDVYCCSDCAQVAEEWNIKPQ